MTTAIRDSMADDSTRDNTGDTVDGADVNANDNTLADILDGTTTTRLAGAGELEFLFASSHVGINLISIDNAAPSVLDALSMEWDPGDGGNMTDTSSGVAMTAVMPNDADAQTIFGRLQHIVNDDAAGSEDSEWQFIRMVAGTLTAQTFGAALSNDGNNRVVTADGSGGINGEANLTFDGSNLLAPSQPAFSAYNSATDADVTGDGTTATVDFDTEVFDNGSDFASDTFTAPVTGKYQLNCHIQLQDLDTDTFEDAYINIVTSNRSYIGPRFSGTTYETGTGLGILGINLSVLADMDASDTATVTVVVSGGTKTVDIGGTSAPATSFSGFLVVA